MTGGRGRPVAEYLQLSALEPWPRSGLWSQGACLLIIISRLADRMPPQVYDAASDPDGDPDIDPFDEKDRAGLAVERYMLRKALR